MFFVSWQEYLSRSGSPLYKVIHIPSLAYSLSPYPALEQETLHTPLLNHEEYVEFGEHVEFFRASISNAGYVISTHHIQYLAALHTVHHAIGLAFASAGVE